MSDNELWSETRYHALGAFRNSKEETDAQI